MKKTILTILLCGVFTLSITGCSNDENNYKEIESEKDRVSGSNYKVYGLDVNVPVQYANRWVINNLKIEFLNGNYTISYCIDDIFTNTNCDISKHIGNGKYTINGDTLRLNITESTTTDVELGITEINNIDTSRICKIVEDNQIIIDCKDSGGFIYFSNSVDDNYYKKSECDIFNGKTYAGNVYISGYYLRNGQWISNPTTLTQEFTFLNGKLEDTYNGIFNDDSCEKINDTTYTIGQRKAKYDATTDAFIITIGTVNGINYGTMEFIEKSVKPELVDYPEISNEWICDEVNCKLNPSTSLKEMKKFAEDNGLNMKIIYEPTNSQIPNGTVNYYCDVEHSTDDFCLITYMTGKKAVKGETFIISVERHP